ncbi:MAG: DUF881 domain-containing protein [Dermatophilaceae bacterium]
MSHQGTDRPDSSMTLITEMMQRPLDPGYAAAAESRQQAGLPPATSHRGPMLVIFAVLIGALLAAAALSLRAPTTSAGEIKSALVGRIEAGRAQADAKSRVIAGLRREIDSMQAAALNQQSQSQLAADLSQLELVTGTVAVTGPGLVLTVDDAPIQVISKDQNANPGSDSAPDKGKVIARDLQILVNGLWQAGAEAVSVNGHRLTARSAIRFAGAAILVDYRPLVRPYTITAIGDPGSLSVEFADNDGGSYLQWLKVNYGIRGDLKAHDTVVVPGAPALSLQEAQPLHSSVTQQVSPTTLGRTSPSTSPQTTETSP